MINQLPPSDEMFTQLSGSFMNHAFEGLVSEKNDRSKKIALLLFVVVLAYAGVEAVKLIFRKNFGKKGINIWKLVLTIGAFITVGIIAYNTYSSYSGDLTEYGSKDSFLYTSIFYFCLVLFIIIKGVIELRKRDTNNVHPSYRGDNVILSFLQESGWSQAKVQNLAEPLLILGIGIFLSPINVLLGLPLVFCAVSVWLHYAYEAIRGLLIARNQLADNKGYPKDNSKTFSRVIN